MSGEGESHGGVMHVNFFSGFFKFFGPSSEAPPLAPRYRSISNSLSGGLEQFKSLQAA